MTIVLLESFVLVLSGQYSTGHMRPYRKKYYRSINDIGTDDFDVNNVSPVVSDIGLKFRLKNVLRM